jgi:hypothetical protein
MQNANPKAIRKNHSQTPITYSIDAFQLEGVVEDDSFAVRAQASTKDQKINSVPGAREIVYLQSAGAPDGTT